MFSTSYQKRYFQHLKANLTKKSLLVNKCLIFGGVVQSMLFSLPLQTLFKRRNSKNFQGKTVENNLQK